MRRRADCLLASESRPNGITHPSGRTHSLAEVEPVCYATNGTLRHHAYRKPVVSLIWHEPDSRADLSWAVDLFIEGSGNFMTAIDQAETEILRCLLADFRERNLTATDLERLYEGVPLSTLRKHCADTIKGVTDVDFDLAFEKLEKGGLIQTGPLAPYRNSPGSMVRVVGLYSKKEYACLTKDGYRAAQ